MAHAVKCCKMLALSCLPKFSSLSQPWRCPSWPETPAGAVSNPFQSGLLGPVGSSQGLGTLLGQSPSFADPSGRIGYVYSFSFGIQKQLSNQVRIEASYVGSRTHDAPVTKTYNALSAQNLALGDATQGGNPNTLNQQVPNPFQGLLPGTSLNSATVSQQQLRSEERRVGKESRSRW